jgi:outer membrane protein W
MSSYCFSRYKYIVIVLVFATCVQIFSLGKFYFFGMGGANYIPMRNYAHYLNEMENPKIDEVGFNGCLGIKMQYADNHVFVISSEITNKNASYSGGFTSAIWNFKVIPISIGYQYLFSEKENALRPYAGLSVSHSFIEIKGEYADDMPPRYTEIRKGTKFCIEPNFGVVYEIAERLSLISEIKYRYMSDIEYLYQSLNLSGVVLNAGIQINIL